MFMQKPFSLLTLTICSVLLLSSCNNKKKDKVPDESPSVINTPTEIGAGTPPTTQPPNEGNPPVAPPTTLPGDGTNPPSTPPTTLPGDGTNPPSTPPTTGPTPVQPPQGIGKEQCYPDKPRISGGSLYIDNGSVFTTLPSVSLQLSFGPEVSMMKVSADDQCGCGVWEPYSTEKVQLLKSLNAKNFFSVQFRDYEFQATQCLTANISHDNLPPELQLQVSKTEVFDNESVTVSYLAQDLGSGLRSLQCSLNGVNTNCSNPGGTLNFANQTPGAYTYNVAATDNLGQITQKSVIWNVNRSLKEVEQSLSIKANNKVDVLFIIDNSGSMAPEQTSMAQRISSFMRQIAGLDYRIAVTTTDPQARVVYGDGQLAPLSGLKNEYVLSPNRTLAENQDILGKTLQRSEVGYWDEQGIFALFRSIERFFDLSIPNNPNRQFYRPDAGLAAVVISDENEAVNGTKNQPKNLVNYITQVWPDKNFAFHSIIAREGDTACLAEKDHSAGTRYAELSRITGLGTVGGSIIGSVCAPDYGSQLAGIGASVQQMNRTITLDCAPVGPAQSSVVILKDGNNFTESYELQVDKLVFKDNLPTGEYRLSYRCKI